MGASISDFELVRVGRRRPFSMCFVVQVLLRRSRLLIFDLSPEDTRAAFFRRTVKIIVIDVRKVYLLSDKGSGISD